MHVTQSRSCSPFRSLRSFYLLFLFLFAPRSCKVFSVRLQLLAQPILLIARRLSLAAVRACSDVRIAPLLVSTNPDAVILTFLPMISSRASTRFSSIILSSSVTDRTQATASRERGRGTPSSFVASRGQSPDRRNEARIFFGVNVCG